MRSSRLSDLCFSLISICILDLFWICSVFWTVSPSRSSSACRSRHACNIQILKDDGARLTRPWGPGTVESHSLSDLSPCGKGTHPGVLRLCFLVTTGTNQLEELFFLNLQSTSRTLRPHRMVFLNFFTTYSSSCSLSGTAGASTPNLWGRP